MRNEEATKLDNWSVHLASHADAFAAPELQRKVLEGEVGGKSIRTSPIDNVHGRIVTTRSGTNYELMKPNESYLAHLEKAGIDPPTEEEPIRTLSAKPQK